MPKRAETIDVQMEIEKLFMRAELSPTEELRVLCEMAHERARKMERPPRGSG